MWLFHDSEGVRPPDVQEIFVRLNTGGEVPTQSDLVFSLINVEHFDYQQRVREVASEIREASKIDLDEDDILQFIFFVRFGTPKIDYQRVDKRETIQEFNAILGRAIDPLKVFYKRFLYDNFRINSKSLYRSQLALLPLQLYFYEHNLTNLANCTELSGLNRFFVLSQLNDWSLQTLLTGFAGLIREGDHFPYTEMANLVQAGGRRNVTVSATSMQQLPYFSLKILVPNKEYRSICISGQVAAGGGPHFPEEP